MIHPAIYTPQFTFELCYKAFGILLRVTKNRKVLLSSHDGFQKVHNIYLALHRSQGRGGVARIFSFPQYILNFLNSRSIYLWLQSIHHANFCRKPWFRMKELAESATINLKLVAFCYLKILVTDYHHLLISTSGTIAHEEDHSGDRFIIPVLSCIHPFWYSSHNVS